MTKEQKVIVKLCTILDDIVQRCIRRDLSFARIAGISGCNMYQGMPPIKRTLDGICDGYENVINAAFQAQKATKEKSRY